MNGKIRSVRAAESRTVLTFATEVRAAAGTLTELNTAGILPVTR